MADINVEELKDAAPIVDYIKQFYGNLFDIKYENNSMAKSKCIWHKDNESPSLVFFKTNNTYKCFGCGEHGDLIVLVQKLENVNFQEACKIIGDNIGYEVILTPLNQYHEDYKNKMDNHTRRYWCNYQVNPKAIEYMEIKRGITKDVLTEFRVGVTDVNEYQYRQDIGNISNRITFPILEPKKSNAKCIGIGYRTLGNDKPKYVNDVNQDGSNNKDPNLKGVFIKGNCLFGYTQAYDYIKKNNYLILTEGYMDVISLHQSNIKNVVCAMGTSITDAQVDLIKKLTSNILLMMDSDKAGINSMLKILPTLYQANLNVKTCILDKGYDPADLCLKNNFEYKAIMSVIRQNTIDGISFAVNESVKDYETYIIQKRRDILNKMTPLLSSMNSTDRIIFKDILYKRLGL